MIKIALRFICYKLFAPHRKGFGVHSPFVFNLVCNVLNGRDDAELKEISVWRKKLSKDTSIITTADAGAGSKTHKTKGRSVGQIVRKSSIRHKYGRVIYKLVNEFKPSTIIELGTGIGISTAYLAKTSGQSHVITIEADAEKLTFAGRSLEQIGVDNVLFRNGSFNELLPEILKEEKQAFMVFVDGDHSYTKTIDYFEEIKKHINEESFIVFDDIRWSEDMEKAWGEIRRDPAVSISIDLFFMGMVFFRGGVPKQDFVINF